MTSQSLQSRIVRLMADPWIVTPGVKIKPRLGFDHIFYFIYPHVLKYREEMAGRRKRKPRGKAYGFRRENQEYETQQKYSKQKSNLRRP